MYFITFINPQVIVAGMGIDTLYNLFLTALLAGAVIAGFSLALTQETPEAFVSVYFSDPKALPTEMYSGQPLLFEANAVARNGPLHDVRYSADIAYYKLYDITEGTYNCLGKYRNKLFVHWENLSVGDEQVAPLRTAYTAEKPINDIPWDQYHLEFGIQRLAGMGALTVLFGRNESPHYRVGIDLPGRQILWNGDPVPFNNTAVNSRGQEYSLIDFSGARNMNMHLFVKDGAITVYVNGVLVFSRKYGRLHNGRFWFETRGMYANIMGGKIYRDTPIAVPDRGDVLDLVVSADLVLKGSRQVKSALATSVELGGRFLEGFAPAGTDEGLYFAIDCGKPLCVSNYPDRLSLDPKQENYFFYRLAYENYTGARSYYYSPLTQNMEAARLNWDEYLLSFTVLPLTGPRKAALAVGNQYAAELDVANSRMRILSRAGRTVNEAIYPLGFNLSGLGEHEIAIDTRNGSLGVVVDKVPIGNRTPISGGAGMPIVLFRDGRGTMGTIKASNSAADCDDPSKILACQKSFKSKDQPQSRPTTRRDYTPIVEPTEPEPSPVAVAPLKAPSTVLAFGGPEAVLQNVEDYFFTFGYAALDGKRRVLLIFESANGSRYDFEIDEAAGHVAFIPVENRKSTTFQRYTHEREFGEPTWRTFRLNYQHGTAGVYIDDEFIFSFQNLDMGSGIFTLRLDETFGHFQNVYLKDRGTGRRRDFVIRDNPCQLREVSRVTLQSGVLDLEPQRPQRFPFEARLGENVTSPFDFAQVSVGIGGQAVHFWVVSQ